MAKATVRIVDKDKKPSAKHYTVDAGRAGQVALIHKTDPAEHRRIREKEEETFQAQQKQIRKNKLKKMYDRSNYED